MDKDKEKERRKPPGKMTQSLQATLVVVIGFFAVMEALENWNDNFSPEEMARKAVEIETMTRMQFAITSFSDMEIQQNGVLTGISDNQTAMLKTMAILEATSNQRLNVLEESSKEYGAAIRQNELLIRDLQ